MIFGFDIWIRHTGFGFDLLIWEMGEFYKMYLVFSIQIKILNHELLNEEWSISREIESGKLNNFTKKKVNGVIVKTPKGE